MTKNIMLGKIIGNKYVTIKRLGKGEFSEVWLCMTTTKKYYAVKIINNINSGNIDSVQLLDSIKHPNCLTYIEKISTKNETCMVQQLMAGSVYDVMSQQYPNGFTYRSACCMIHDLLTGLAHIHSKQIIHADIKPENMLLVGLTNHVCEIISKIDEQFQNSKKCLGSCSNLSRQLKSLFAQKKDKNSDSNDTSSPNESETGVSSNTTNDTSTDNSADENEVSDTSSVSTASDIHSEHTGYFGRDDLTSNTETTSEHLSDESVPHQIIDNKFVDNPKVLLGDFGNSISFDDEPRLFGDIQTRHYRAPEIILRRTFDEKSDIWAVGCTFFELLTGKVFIDPHKSNGISTDKQNIRDIQTILGDIPNKLKNSRKQQVFYRTDGTLKGYYDNEQLELRNIVFNPSLTIEQLDNVIEFMNATLNYDPNLRPTAKECLEMRLFHIS